MGRKVGSAAVHVIQCFRKALRHGAYCRVVSLRLQHFVGISLRVDDNGAGFLLIQL